MDDVANEQELEKLQQDCGIVNLPTPFTFELRKAVSGEGPRAYDWSDKPHRLVYDACAEVERLTRTLAEKDATIVYLAEAVIELSDNVQDRDGLTNHAEIAVDTARATLAKHGGNNG